MRKALMMMMMILYEYFNPINVDADNDDYKDGCHQGDEGEENNDDDIRQDSDIDEERDELIEEKRWNLSKGKKLFQFAFTFQDVSHTTRLVLLVKTVKKVTYAVLAN